MRKHNSVGLVFGKTTYVILISALIILACAGVAIGQYMSGYSGLPSGQNVQSGLPTYGQSTYSMPIQPEVQQPGTQQYLPADFPPTISVPGLDMTGLVQGDNNISYAIKVLSQDENNIYFQVKAFCVYNTQSEYAILHILNKPLMGVIDRQKNTMQIDFSQLSDSIESIRVIRVSDVDQTLLQSKDLMVLNTVMSMDSSDGSTVKFSISDMSLLEPDGVLNDLALPGPVQGIYDTGNARLSTVAYPEMANLFQQNYVAVQQNTFINVVNQVNVVNVINVVDIGGFGCGYGSPYGGYGYGGYGGGYGGGFVPCSEPLPLPYGDAYAGSPLEVPSRVHVYGDVPAKGHRKLDRPVEDTGYGGASDAIKDRGHELNTAPSPVITDDHAVRAPIVPKATSSPRVVDTGKATKVKGDTLKPVKTPEVTHVAPTTAPTITTKSTPVTGKQLADQAALTADKHKGDAQNKAQQLSTKTKAVATPAAPKPVASQPKTVTNSVPRQSDPAIKTVKAPDTSKAVKQTTKPADVTTHKQASPVSTKSTPQKTTVKSSPAQNAVKPVQKSTPHTVSAPTSHNSNSHSTPKAPSAPASTSAKHK